MSDETDRVIAGLLSEAETRLLFYVNSTRKDFRDEVHQYTLEIIKRCINARLTLDSEKGDGR